ncbi:hypothetical protein HRbin17_02590 [bacterium HR17]|uniref:Uncharacterized protein n=1 Tax=Candidatus Fervidibacter japonicus TaxID=2035412 RepID=A0A2H5XFV4_9BACT|nr:hypothetical protein HRbin17_02590 [bacterium HR17]
MAAPSATTPSCIAEPPTRLLWRLVPLMVVLVPFNLAWVLQLEVIQFVSWPTILAVPMNALALLVVLTGLNRCLKALGLTSPLRQGELVLLYTVLGLSSAIGGTDFLQVLVSMMGYPFFFATPENRWRDLFLPLLPSALTVQDKNALQGFYYGDASLYRRDHFAAWLLPCGLWLLFVSCLVTAMVCLCLLLRRRWSEEERLTYPLIWVPLQVTEEAGTLWRTAMFWWGIGTAVGVTLINGLHGLVPSLPQLPLRGQLDWTQLIPQRPWNALGAMPFGIYPFAIGLGIFMPLDLSFSCWFFYLVHRLERVMVAALGWDVEPRVPYFPEQATATWVALCLFLLWHARASLWRSWTAPPLSDEPLPLRWAFFGFAVCFLLLTAFGWFIGLPLGLSAVYFALYFLLSLSFTRARAELGAIAHDLPFGGPTNVLTTLLGTQRLAPKTLTALALLYWFNRSYGSHPMPFLLEGMRMAKETGVPLRPLPALFLGTTVVSFVAFFWLVLDLMYRLGAATARVKGDIVRYYVDIYPQLQAWLTVPTLPRRDAAAWMTGAFLGTWAMMHWRWRQGGLPFHPMGYALASNWSMDYLWCSLLISWAIKAALLHYGGAQGYRKTVPLFVGLVVGEAVAASCWGAVSLVLERPTYSFWP